MIPSGRTSLPWRRISYEIAGPGPCASADGNAGAAAMSGCPSPSRTQAADTHSHEPTNQDAASLQHGGRHEGGTRSWDSGGHRPTKGHHASPHGGLQWLLQLLFDRRGPSIIEPGASMGCIATSSAMVVQPRMDEPACIAVSATGNTASPFSWPTACPTF
ncbi:hypothetical protein WJX84_012190 [Apatococcus fuscideae]|uniref:Uncharacterized protein n=1 Tax=Apatococcus fuscideae TaxID=2026836 RepID=A0AAW1T0T5_9CHLO